MAHRALPRPAAAPPRAAARRAPAGAARPPARPLLRRGRCAGAAAPAAASLLPSFKQTKESVQWTTVALTFVALASFVAVLMLVPRPVLLPAAAVAAACVLASFAAEAVGDARRRARLESSGVKAAWLAKAASVAAAAQAKADAAAGAGGAKAVVAFGDVTWEERNVAGAASEEDARLIRETNEFLS